MFLQYNHGIPMSHSTNYIEIVSHSQNYSPANKRTVKSEKKNYIKTQTSDINYWKHMAATNTTSASDLHKFLCKCKFNSKNNNM